MERDVDPRGWLWMCVFSIQSGNHKWLSLILKMSSAYGHTSKQPQSLLEWQTCPDHSSVTPNNLQGLLPQYIEDRRHQFPAYLFYPSLWWWLFSKGKMLFIYVNLMNSLQESEANPFTLLRTMVTFFYPRIPETSCQGDVSTHTQKIVLIISSHASLVCNKWFVLILRQDLLCWGEKSKTYNGKYIMAKSMVHEFLCVWNSKQISQVHY